MVPSPGRLGRGVKLPVQVWLFPEEIATVDAFTEELRQQSYGAAFSRAEALRIAAMEWLKARQARRVRVTTSPPSSAPEAARVMTEAVTTVTAPSPPAVPAAVEPRLHEAAAAAEEAAMAATPSPPKRPRACPCRALTPAPVGSVNQALGRAPHDNGYFQRESSGKIPLFHYGEKGPPQWHPTRCFTNSCWSLSC
jgi:hypothetical protein